MKQFLIALDQLANTVIGGFADETLSARAYRWHITGGPKWPLYVIETIFFWEREHCKTSFWAEKARKQLPDEYSETTQLPDDGSERTRKFVDTIRGCYTLLVSDRNANYALPRTEDILRNALRDYESGKI